jgi:hypothetical protein
MYVRQATYVCAVYKFLLCKSAYHLAPVFVRIVRRRLRCGNYLDGDCRAYNSQCDLAKHIHYIVRVTVRVYGYGYYGCVGMCVCVVQMECYNTCLQVCLPASERQWE